MRVSSELQLPETYEETGDISTEFHSDSTHNSSEFDQSTGCNLCSPPNKHLHDASSSLSLTPVLRQIISNAEKNAQRLPTGRRHSVVLKKFATSLFIYAGPLTYNFFAGKSSTSLTFSQKHSEHCSFRIQTINEDEFRFNKLAAHITA